MKVLHTYDRRTNGRTDGRTDEQLNQLDQVSSRRESKQKSFGLARWQKRSSFVRSDTKRDAQARDVLHGAETKLTNLLMLGFNAGIVEKTRHI